MPELLPPPRPTAAEVAARILNRSLTALSRLRWQYACEPAPVAQAAVALARQALEAAPRGDASELAHRAAALLDRAIRARVPSPQQREPQRDFRDFYAWLFEAFQTDRDTTLLLLAYRDQSALDAPLDEEAVLCDSGLSLERAREAMGRLRARSLLPPPEAPAPRMRFGGVEGWKEFFAFLAEPRELAPWRDGEGLGRGLEALGLDFRSVEDAAARALAGAAGPAEAAAAPGDWLSIARERLRRLDGEWGRQARVSQGFLDAAALLAAIRDGKLGEPVRTRAEALYGGEPAERLSETDLRSFLDDCELLGLISRPQRVKPIGES